MNEFTLSISVLVSVALGALLSWLIGRGRTQAAVEAAVAKAESTSQSELAQLRERIRAADETRRLDQLSHEALVHQTEALRRDMTNEKDESAKFAERALRVPVLEQEAHRLQEELRKSGAEVLRISSEAAQKGQAVVSLTEQVSDLETSNRSIVEKSDLTTAALNVANERNAALEEQSVRIPALEGSVAAAAAEIDRLGALLTDLREASGAETARLVGERSAHALVREELASVKLALENAESTAQRLIQQLAELRELNGGETARLEAEREAHALVRRELAMEKAGRDSADIEVGRLNGELTGLRTKLDAEREGATEKLALLLNAKEALTNQFKSLASDILEEKSKRFAEQNQVNLGQLLDPLRTQLTEFKGKVEEVYVQEGKDRSALSEQVRQLVGLNQALSQDAKNLTLALKGSAKTQGNWGELVLERVLEASGLRKGHEYHVQESQQREDGTRAQADVVINLPEERRLVVDAKVSLVAYEAHITAETDDERALAVRRHLDSVKTHIRGLSGKQYQALYGLKSLDFVLMFIPIEPAFMMAVTHDNELFMDAWDRNVLLVSPSTLLFVVRTVAHLWRQEQQSRNSQEIAKRGAELYDRLVAFVEDLQTVGNRLSQAQSSYDTAFKKLTTNKGNVIRQAEMLRELGVKPGKTLPNAVLEGSSSEDDIILVGSPVMLAASDMAGRLSTASGSAFHREKAPEGTEPSA